MTTAPKKKPGPASGVLTPAYKAEQERLNLEGSRQLAALAKRPPGRPPTGRTPDAERQKASRARIAKAGGKRVTINLAPDATAALAWIRGQMAEGGTDRGAIELALVMYAKRSRKAP